MFFSGTDLSEVNENSEFHNYYLSLIVNNKGEKCAKIAFRAKVVEDVNRVLTFKGNDGVLQTRTSTEQVEKEYVYLIDCDIEEETSFDVEQAFIDRTEEIITAAAEASKIKAFKATNTTNTTQNTKGTQTFPSLQPGLFKESPMAGFNSVKPSDFAINVFLSKIISRDQIASSSYFESLKDVQKKLGTSKKKTNEFSLAYYIDEVTGFFLEDYLNEFQDEDFRFIDSTLTEIIKKLEAYSRSYWVAEELAEALTDFQKALKD